MATIKNVKSPHILNSLTDFDEIRHGDAYWPPSENRPLKFRIFDNLRTAAVAILKVTKIMTSQQRFDRPSQNLAWSCKNGTLITPTIRNLNLQNPRWRTAAILKTFNSPYLCNCSTNFNKIWHSDVLSPFQITHTYTLDNVHYSQAQGLNLKHRRSLGGKTTVDI